MESVCAVCGRTADTLQVLADHFIAEAAASDIRHVMWLNRNVTKYQVGAPELTALLGRWAARLPTAADRVQR
jgi:hypothetical protein